jgi:hypothetical protein
MAEVHFTSHLERIFHSLASGLRVDAASPPGGR